MLWCKACRMVRAVIAWCNIGWMENRFNQAWKREQLLDLDQREALINIKADVILLTECGEIDTSLPEPPMAGNV